MTLKQLGTLFNTSLRETFHLKKLLFLFCLLVGSGFLYVLFHSVALFVVFGLLMAGGTLVLQEGKGRLKERLRDSWELVLKASYLALPLLLAYFVFWGVIGIFQWLQTVPYVGVFVTTLLAGVPFLLNVATLLLFLAALAALFFVVPTLAKTQHYGFKALLERVMGDLFTHLLLFVVALLPAWLIWRLGGGAAQLTFEAFALSGVERLVQAFFVMLPFVALLTPALLFFLHFARHAHALSEK